MSLLLALVGKVTSASEANAVGSSGRGWWLDHLVEQQRRRRALEEAQRQLEKAEQGQSPEYAPALKEVEQVARREASAEKAESRDALSKAWLEFADTAKRAASQYAEFKNRSEAIASAQKQRAILVAAIADYELAAEQKRLREKDESEAIIALLLA